MTESNTASSLVDWYWLYGCKRPLAPALPDSAGNDREKYRLPLDHWLSRLYTVRDELRDLAVAAQPRRPAFALWGLSQTGKSTALAFIDGAVQLPGIEGQDGIGSGLHWEGGMPFIYQPPLRNLVPDYWHGCAFNPFNGEDDGSACLTRLVAAGLGRGSGWRVHDPQHPVLVRLLKPVELLNTIARGYDTQCLGPEKAGRHSPWTAHSLEEAVDRVAARFSASQKSTELAPEREATERVLKLISTIEDLHIVRVESFSKIAEDRASLRQLLDRLLLQKDVFVSDRLAADAVTARLLWGGAQFISAAYEKLRARHEYLLNAWGEKEVYATLSTAMLFVDFGSAINLLKGKSAAVRQRIQGRLIESLGWEIRGDVVLIGSGPEYTHKLGTTPDDYATMQALVWELVLPVNMAHLPDGAGKRLLEQADILDFPGVGKDALNETSRLNLGVGNLAGGKQPETTDFFGKILKRGKTASVVANYATRRNIDAFAILQSLKTDTAPSAEMTGQILEGCEAWARFAGHSIGPDVTAPLPLNFVLTFWGLKASQFRAGTESNFQNAIGKMIESYGWVRSRSTAWALNYHWFRTPDGEALAAVDLKRFGYGTDDYQAVTREKEFLDVFGNDVSRASFDAMLQDQATGGLDFFLRTIAQQLSTIDLEARRTFINELILAQKKELDFLCSYPHLRPPFEQRDRRIDTLNEFRRRIIERAAPYGDVQVREVSYALRQFLNVDPEQLPYPPLNTESLDQSYIDRLFFVWREAQIKRFDSANSQRNGDKVAWDHLCLADRIEFGEVLQSLIECLGDKVFANIARCSHRWQRSLEGQQPDFQANHLRRYIAAEMVNWLCFFFPDPEQPESRRRESPERDGHWKYVWPESRKGLYASTPCLQTAAWQQFPGPVLDEHFAYVLGTKSKKPERPELPGDFELCSILPPQS